MNWFLYDIGLRRERVNIHLFFCKFSDRTVRVETLTISIDKWHWQLALLHFKSHWQNCDIVQSLFSNGCCKVIVNTENIVLSFQDQSSANYFSSSSSYRPYLKRFFLGAHERSCMQMILFWSRKPRKISVLNCRYSWQIFYNQNGWKSACLR